MFRTSVLVCIVIISPAAILAEVPLDTFEDGDFTVNPVWTEVPTGQAAVLGDPLRTGNLVLGISGSDSGHHRLLTSVSGAWQGFVFEVEFLASDGNFSPLIGVQSGDYFAGIWLIGPNAQPHGTESGTRWLIRTAATQGGSPDWFAGDPSHPILPTAPVGEWWRLRLYHNIADGLITALIYRASDGQLIASRTIMPGLAVPNSSVDTFLLSAEETSLQYFDYVRFGDESGVDAEGDTVPDSIDNCPTIANFQQVDTDFDGIGDVCDMCPNDGANLCIPAVSDWGLVVFGLAIASAGSLVMKRRKVGTAHQ